MVNSSENQLKNQTTQFTMQRMVGLATEFGFMIALPLVAFGLFGKWLDSRTSHKYLFTLIGILTAVIASSVILGRRINSIRKSLRPASKAGYSGH